MNSVAFSPDGQKLASGGLDRAVRLWSVATGRPERALVGHQDMVYRLAYSPDGRLLATASWDKTIRVWDARTGEQRQLLDGHRGAVLDLAFSPDGRRLASASRDGRVRIWRVRSGRRIRTLAGGGEAVVGLAWGAGERLASTSYDGQLRLWDAETGELLASARQPRPYGVAFSPDGEQIATSGWDGAIRLWDVPALSHRILGRHDGRAYRVAFRPDGTVGSVGSDGRILLWSTAVGEERPQAIRAHRGEANDLSFSADGGLVASSGDDGTVRLWRLPDGTPLWRTTGVVGTQLLTHRGWQALDNDGARRGCGPRCREVVDRSLAAAMTPDGVLCRIGADRHLELWPGFAGSASPLRRELSGEVGRLIALDEACVVVVGEQLTVLHRSGRSRVLGLPAGAVVAGEADGFLVAAAGRLRAFDAGGREAGRSLAIPAGVSAVVRDAGRRVLGFVEGQVEVHRPGEATLALQQTPASAALALRPVTGELLVVGFANGMVGTWSLTDGALLERAWLHGAVTRLVADGDRVFAVSELGDHRALDHRAVRQPYCQLLREVWARVPVLWERGVAVQRAPPASHACAMGLAARLAASM